MGLFDFFINLGKDVGQAAYQAGQSYGTSLQQAYTPQQPSPQPTTQLPPQIITPQVQAQQPAQAPAEQPQIYSTTPIYSNLPYTPTPQFQNVGSKQQIEQGMAAAQRTPTVLDDLYWQNQQRQYGENIIHANEEYRQYAMAKDIVVPVSPISAASDAALRQQQIMSGITGKNLTQLPSMKDYALARGLNISEYNRGVSLGGPTVYGARAEQAKYAYGNAPAQISPELILPNLERSTPIQVSTMPNYFGAESTMQPLKLPEGLRVAGETQTPSYEMGGGKQMWVLGAAGMAALPINAKGELSLGVPGSPEVQNLTGQPIPPKSAIGAFMDVFTMRSPLEYIPPVGVWNVLTRADPYLSGVIKANAGPLTTYATGPGKSTIIGGLMEPIIERPASTAGLAGAMYLGGALVSGVVSAVSPYVIPAIEAAPWGAGFLRALPAVTTIGMGAAAGGGVIVDVYSAQPAQRERVLGRDITTIGISAYSFMKGANPEWSLSETLRPATNTISDTAAGGYRRIDELIYGFRQQSAGFENIGIGGGARAGGIYTEPTFTNPPSPLSGGGGYPGISGENYPLGLPDLTGNLLSPKPISNFPGNVGGTLDIGQRAMMLAYGTTEPHFVETMTKMQALDYRSLNQKIFDIGEIRLTESRKPGTGQFAPSTLTPLTKPKPLGFDIGKAKLTESRISGVGQFAPSLPTPSTKLEPFSFDIGWVESSLTKTPPYSGTKSEVIARQSETNIGFINNLIKGTPIPKTESQPQLQMQMEPALPSQSTRPYKPAQMDWNQARKLSKTELQVEPQLQMQMEPVISTQLSSQYKPAQMDWNRARKILKTERQLQTQGGIAVTSISNAISPHTAQRSSRSSFIGGALSLGLPKILETPPAETRRSYPLITPGITAINFPKTTPAPSPGLTPSQNLNVWPFPYETPQTTPKIKPPIPQVPIIPILPGLPSGPGGPSDLRMRRSRRFLETFPVGLDISFMGGWYSGKKPRKKSYKARRKKK